MCTQAHEKKKILLRDGLFYVSSRNQSSYWSVYICFLSTIALSEFCDKESSSNVSSLFSSTSRALHEPMTALLVMHIMFYFLNCILINLIFYLVFSQVIVFNHTAVRWCIIFESSIHYHYFFLARQTNDRQSWHLLHVQFPMQAVLRRNAAKHCNLTSLLHLAQQRPVRQWTQLPQRRCAQQRAAVHWLLATTCFFIGLSIFFFILVN